MTNKSDDQSGNITWKVVCGAFGTVIFFGFCGWMTMVQTTQVAQADEISSMKSRLATLETKVDALGSDMKDVKSGVNSLVNTLVRKNSN